MTSKVKYNCIGAPIETSDNDITDIVYHKLNSIYYTLHSIKDELYNHGLYGEHCFRMLLDVLDELGDELDVIKETKIVFEL